MAFTLSADLEHFVEEKVSSGDYASPEEVVRESFRLLQERDDFFRFRLESLRRDVAAGVRQLDSGQTRIFDPEDMKRRVREQLAAEAQAQTAVSQSAP